MTIFRGRSFWKARRTAPGSALIIVLFFIVLLTGLTIAFLSRSLTAIKVSAGSANETEVNLLANSSADIIIGDLRQEIIAGSTTGTGSTTSYPIYVPKANATMIPAQSGTPASSLTISNLIRRSVSPANTGSGTTDPYVPYNTAAYYTSSQIPPTRAASDPTATGTYTSSKVNSSTPSLNGRYISAAQWNSHYLIPRNPLVDTPGSTVPDSTPVTSFVPPDWVIVTRGAGASSSSTALTWSSSLSDSTSTNPTYAVGRFAYAIYNEGGLLDMNAAGYPADPTAGGTNGLTAAQISQKGSLALADLTQLTSGTVTMTQAQINNIVGWRNYASAELTSANGYYGNFTFTPATASDWLTNFVSSNTNGFMKIVSPTGVTTPPTDQAFLSRQQLIGLAQSLSISPDFLQYLGTFSRSLEQPSFVPDPNRPKILTTGGAPPDQTLADSYTGNNDAQGLDTNTSTSNNPPFLSVRVVKTFTRLNGTTAVVGEPLVKTKFALSRLALVTYSATNTQTAGDPIYDRFGIYRTSTASPWTYNHGGTNGVILTLSQVANLTTPREPDFAELLKAAIAAGSLGKGGPNFHNGQGNNYQYTLDVTTDLQVLQIMANLIDQQDTDSYPTVIQLYNTPHAFYMPVYGVEDLPYFYRFHYFSVVDRVPVPVIPSQSAVVFQPLPMGTTSTGTTTMATNVNTGATETGSWSVTNTSTVTFLGAQKITSTSLTDQGEATFFYIPDLWNPHDPNNVASSGSNRPTNFRIYMVTEDPAGITTPMTIGDENQLNGSKSVVAENDYPLNNPPINFYWPIGMGANKPQPYVIPTGTTTPPNTTLTFSDNNGTLFREPTMLWNSNPTGLNLSGPSVKDANTGQTYYGFLIGKAPISIQVNFTSTPVQPTDGNYIFQANNTGLFSTSTGVSFNQDTMFLQYQDVNGNWITYDAKYPDFHGPSDPGLVVNTADYPNGSWQDPLMNYQWPAQMSSIDPRSARWGVATGNSEGNNGNNGGGDYLLEPTANTDFTNNTFTDFKTRYFSVLETERPRADPGNYASFSNPAATFDPGRNVQMRWGSPIEYRYGSSTSWGGSPTSPLEADGLFSQNTGTLTSALLAQDKVTLDGVFYEDPDGVARRAMASYASSSLTDSSASSQASAASPSANRIGMPLATASTLSDQGVPTATAQSQSRPIVLNRPFRSVSEMSYAFRGTPWKNIDFFNPESGDSALLDTFCLTELPSNALVAGKVDLNTRQAPVLQAIVAGAYRDEFNNVTTPPSYALPPLTSTEAAKVAAKLVAITTDTNHGWRGPLQNIAGLVGRYVASPGSTSGYTDVFTYVPVSPVAGQSTSSTYAGLSAALDSTVYNSTTNAVWTSAPLTPTIQRFRESAIRPLVSAGQVRVWNLLIDLVVQTGRYPRTSTSLDQFLVNGQKRVWLHVAIDRYTGQILDKQMEVVTP